MSAPHIVVILLNNNRPDDCRECLASIGRSRYENYGVILLNVGSDPRSLPAIQSVAPVPQVVELSENRGYSGNNNVGLRLALNQGADWVFLLNEDTTVDPDCLGHLVKVADTDPRIGIAGPIIYHADEPNVIQSAGGNLSRRSWRPGHIGRNEVDRGQFSGTRSVLWVSGCAMLVRRALIEHVGGLDERFFLYWEEVDWCLRARRGGWTIVHVPQAKVWHKGAQRRYAPAPAVTYYSTRNRFLLLAMHRAPATAWLLAWAQTLRTLASWTIRPKWRQMRSHRNAMGRGICDAIHGRWGRGPL